MLEKYCIDLMFIGCNIVLVVWIIYLTSRVHLLSIRLKEVLENYIDKEKNNGNL